MVCIPCIVIPVLLWVFHKYIQPLILKFWNPWKGQSLESTNLHDTPPEGIERDNEEFKFIKGHLQKHPVVMFSKTTCSYCNMAKGVLDETNVEYTIIEIDSRKDCAALQDIFMKMTGSRTVPRVFVGQKCIGGGSETWSVHNQGKLIPMMKEAGALFKNESGKKDN